MKIIFPLLLILVLNGLFFMASETIANTTGAVSLYNYNNSIASRYNSGSYGNYVLTDSLNGTIPAGQNAIDTSGSGSYVDIFATFREWIMDIPVLGVLFSILTGFHNVISMLGIPAVFVYTIDFIWYGFNIVLLFMFLRGDA